MDFGLVGEHSCGGVSILLASGEVAVAICTDVVCCNGFGPYHNTKKSVFTYNYE